MAGVLEGGGGLGFPGLFQVTSINRYHTIIILKKMEVYRNCDLVRGGVVPVCVPTFRIHMGLPPTRAQTVNEHRTMEGELAGATHPVGTGTWCFQGGSDVLPFTSVGPLLSMKDALLCGTDGSVVAPSLPVACAHSS